MLSQLQETNVLQGNNHELKSESEKKQKQLENLEGYSEKLQHATKIQEEIFELKTQLKVFDNMKVKYNMLQEDYYELKSQLAVTLEQLEVSKNYRELEDKEGCNIAVQTDKVRI